MALETAERLMCIRVQMCSEQLRKMQSKLDYIYF